MTFGNEKILKAMEKYLSLKTFFTYGYREIQKLEG